MSDGEEVEAKVDQQHQSDLVHIPPPTASLAKDALALVFEVHVVNPSQIMELKNHIEALPKPMLMSNLTCFLLSTALSLWLTLFGLSNTLTGLPREVILALAVASTFGGLASCIVDYRSRSKHRAAYNGIQKVLREITEQNITQQATLHLDKNKP